MLNLIKKNLFYLIQSEKTPELLIILVHIEMVFDLKIILMKREHFVVFRFLEIENDLKVDM